MEKYIQKEINNATEKQKEEILSGYDEIASAKIFFNGKGDFVVSTEANGGFKFVTDLGGKSSQEAKTVFEKTLSDGAYKLCDYLKKCYISGFGCADYEFINILKRLGIIDE